MAKRIDDETIKKINDLYLELGVKAQVARKLGISPSTVSKYIIPNYKKIEEEQIKDNFNKKPIGCDNFISQIKNYNGSAIAALCNLCYLSDKEWSDMAIIQEGVLI